MKKLTVEIHGAGDHNMGAELMSIAIADAIRNRYPGSRIVVPIEFGDFRCRARHDYLTTWETSGRLRGFISRFGLKCGKKRIRENIGVIDPGEVDVVIDASGFSYSDRWGYGSAMQIVKKMGSRRRRHQKFIMLPQAFGPFTNSRLITYTRRMLNRADLIFAREEISRAYVESLGLPVEVLIAPDFTASVDPVPTMRPFAAGDYVVFVPNVRMIDKGMGRSDYHEHIHEFIRLGKNAGKEILFLIHDKHEDIAVVDEISRKHDIPAVANPDPRQLKYILGHAYAVVGSRFHALVGALSGGVPSIALGWSHKYGELFADYKLDQYCMPLAANTEIFKEQYSNLLNGANNQAIRNMIAKRNVELDALITRMWEMVFAVIDQ
jgi:polysaccharide pyruvyl transferase WcaK-like protein